MDALHTDADLATHVIAAARRGDAVSRARSFRACPDGIDALGMTGALASDEGGSRCTPA